MHYLLKLFKKIRYQQREKNGKESRKHLKLSGISPTVAKILTGSIAK
jgi:hypothetical protein